MPIAVQGRTQAPTLHLHRLHILHIFFTNILQYLVRSSYCILQSRTQAHLHRLHILHKHLAIPRKFLKQPRKTVSQGFRDMVYGYLSAARGGTCPDPEHCRYYKWGKIMCCTICTSSRTSASLHNEQHIVHCRGK